MNLSSQILNNVESNVAGAEYGWFDFNPIERKVIALHTAKHESDDGVDLVKLLQIKLPYHLWMALVSETVSLKIKRAIVDCEYDYRERTGKLFKVKPHLLSAAVSWMEYFETPKAQKIISEANKQNMGTDLERYGQDMYHRTKLN